MEWIQIAMSNELLRLHADEIVYVKADGNYSQIFFHDGRSHQMTIQLHRFVDIFQQLSYNPFVRVGRSLIVNEKYIYRINTTEQKLGLMGLGLSKSYTVEASKDALMELRNKIEKK